VPLAAVLSDQVFIHANLDIRSIEIDTDLVETTHVEKVMANILTQRENLFDMATLITRTKNA
jgi:hypothetical protein